jgi:hypothetical protein
MRDESQMDPRCAREGPCLWDALQKQPDVACIAPLLGDACYLGGVVLLACMPCCLSTKMLLAQGDFALQLKSVCPFPASADLLPFPPLLLAYLAMLRSIPVCREVAASKVDLNYIGEHLRHQTALGGC